MIVESLGLRTACIREPGTLDGGDVLQAGQTVYVGRGGRTNGEGIRQLRALLAPLGRTVIAVPLGNVLHLKSAVTALPDGTFLLLPQLVPAELFPAVRPVDEEAGCHVVPLGGDQVLIAASAPRTAELIDDLGFTPVVADISEFEKLEGCVTCLSVLLPAGKRQRSLLVSKGDRSGGCGSQQLNAGPPGNSSPKERPTSPDLLRDFCQAGDWLPADLRARATQVEAKPMTSTASANHGARTVGLVTL